MAFRILFTVLLICFVANIGSAKVVNDVYQIPKTTVAPVIDGLQDSIWKVIDWNFQTSYGNGAGLPTSWVDLFGMSKLMWDDEAVYGFFYAQDDTLDDAHANAWERDAVEVYFETENVKGHSSGNDLPHQSAS